MGTPGDKTRIKKLSGSKSIQLEDKSGDDLTAEPVPQPHSHQTPQPTEMTVLSHLPHFNTFLDIYKLPHSDKTEQPKEPFVVEDFFTEELCGRETKPETFRSLEEPGPSGLQTPKKTGTKLNIKRIKKNQTNKKLYTCQICEKSFQNSNKLSKHQQVHGNTSPFKCDHCKKSFSSKFKLVRHVLIHSDRKPFSCSVCERTFHRKDHLKNHIKVHSPCKKLYICEKIDCKKEYTSSLSYKKHQALHAAEEGILECQICQKSFKTKDEILYHLKIHAGSRTVKNPDEKKFSCDHCQRKFFTRKDVRRHLVVHTGKRDFLCQFCPQRFGRKDHLVRHIKKSHTKNIQTETAVKDEKRTETSTELLIKSEEESNLSNPESFADNLNLDALFPMLEPVTEEFLPHAATQGELTDLGSEVLNEINETPAEDINPVIFPENLITDDIIDLLQQPSNENLPLPAFSQTFQPPQPPK